MSYPLSAASVMQTPVSFKEETLEAVRRYKNVGPWDRALSGNKNDTIEDRKRKMSNFHNELCRIYNKSTTLHFYDIKLGAGNMASGRSHYNVLTDTITIVNKLSVITYLHEFAHALGKNEYGAVRWSCSLFQQAFPEKWKKLHPQRHGMIR